MKNLFNKKLFIEALKQIRIVGSLIFGVMFGISLIMTYIYVHDAKLSFKFDGSMTNVSVVEAFVFLAILFVIMIPCVTLKLFGFLTKRNASDFYHAIPVTRTCLMFTYTMAILFAGTMILIITSLIPIITFNLNSDIIIINNAAVFNFILNIFVCMILVLGVLLLSSSLTGTFLTNIVFALLILFGPRILIYCLSEIVISPLYEIMGENPHLGFFSYGMNIIPGILIENLSWNSYVEMHVFSVSTIYTFVLGIIYAILAFVAFNKRKSELAENSANGKLPQHMIRISLGYVFYAVIAALFFSTEAEYRDFYFNIGCFVLILAGPSVMVIYELITTRKLRNLINVVYNIPVVAALALITFVILTVSEHNVLNYEPKVEDIDYIHISFSDDYEDSNYYYYPHAITEIEFNNKEILEFLITNYNEEIKVYRESKNDDGYYYGFVEEYGKHNYVYVQFNDGIKKTDRIVYLDNTEYSEFMLLLESTKEYASLFEKLPDDANLSYGSDLFSKKELDQIVKAFNEDLASLSLEKRMSVLFVDKSPENFIFNFYGDVNDGADEYALDIAIGNDTPKALNCALEILNSKSEASKKDIDELCKLITSLDPESTDYNYAYLHFRIFDLETCEEVGSHYFDTYDSIYYNDYGYEFETFEEYKDATIDYILNSSTLENAKYIGIVRADVSIGDDYKDYHTFFFTDDIDYLENIGYIFK